MNNNYDKYHSFFICVIINTWTGTQVGEEA